MITDVSYKTGDHLTDYEQRRCRLDVYLPTAPATGDVVIWFYGGGLEEGSKDGEPNVAVARGLADEGLLVIMPDYRLYPLAKYPAHIEDAAAAVAWAYLHAAELGANPERLFIGGHSAGAYLALMAGLHPGQLAQARVPRHVVAGLIPVSGQTLTHHATRAERGLPVHALIADEAAPIRWASPDSPPILAIYGDDDMPMRAEENELLIAQLRACGHRWAHSLCVPGRDHGAVGDRIAEPGDPARVAILEFIRSV